MKLLKEIRQGLIIDGARVRLLELNHERDVLLKILNEPLDKSKHSDIIKALRKYKKRKKNPSKKGFKYKPGTHWTQRPENKAKLAKSIKRMLKGHK